ncbi:MAG: hypothetical protein RIR10_1996 [Planctomycetota bacterium]|jgi:hypothetical protein
MMQATRKNLSNVALAVLFVVGFPCATLAAPQSPAQAAPAEKSTVNPISRAARGTTGAFELSYEPAPLRAKATSDLTAPILVRVSTLAPSRYRIEYMGLVSGSYDLAPYLEQVDGRPAQFATPLFVEIFTQLPPNHGTDVFGLSAPSFGLRGHYRTLLIAVGAAWVLVPVAVIALRIARRKPPVPPAPIAREPSLSERLFAIVDDARTRELSTDERGRLELLLLQTLRSAVQESSSSPAAIAAATEALRRDAVHGPVLRAIERWLHAENAGEAQHALQTLETLRAAHTSASAHSTQSSTELKP